MALLILFAFIGGVVTILSPCILPILPIILSSSIGGVETGKARPLGVVVGFVLSFTFFTLFLASIVQASGVSADALRTVSVVILALFGLSLLIPRIQLFIEILFSRFARFAPKGAKRTGFFGGLIVGFSLGLLWTPCVGPILASVISLALTGTVTAQAAVITLAYALGTAIPMFIIMLVGSTALQRVPWLTRNAANIQKAFGVLMLLTAVGIFYNVDRRFQTYILGVFPEYGVGLTSLEDNEKVRKELEKTSKKSVDEKTLGKPLSDMTPQGPLAPELIPGGQWFNSEPLTLERLRGKVVIIDFWTYSCINCQRTFPYLRNWWSKYQDDGLVIIGVHSPEFEFEKDPENVARAIADFKLTYPIVQDNNFATWRAYSNRYWPAKYIIDKDGYIRYTHFGEGKYDETEEMIQKLLKETGSNVTSEKIVNPSYSNYARTPEIYLGYSRIEHFSSPEPIDQDTKASYTVPERLPKNTIAYQGEWTLASEYAAPEKGSTLLLNFEAKEVFLVARPKNGSGKIKVWLDDATQFLGEDVKGGEVTIDSDRLYKLINLSASGAHTLKLEFEDSNIEVYAFTFG